MRNMKIAELLLFAMAALHCGITEDIDFIVGNCNDILRLPCTATDRTKTYRYVMWYKNNNIPVVKRKKHDITYYNMTNVFLEDKETLLLNKVQPSDSGTYKCYLAAEVGGQNDDSFIGLNVSGNLEPGQSSSFPIKSV
ncbi:hypothetical protein cypCar_00002157 [Cyprinus carpio]|nr:hypothetical protein cypCar_00002157 [Cyprinus carpio]